MKTILCPTDFSEHADNTVQYAWALAQKSKAKLILLHTYYVPTVIPYANMQPQPQVALTELEEVRQKLETLRTYLLSKSRQPSAIIETELAYGVPVDKILSEATQRQADLIIMGTEGADGLLERLIGTRAADILEEATCPVLIIPSRATFDPPKRIVYATDCQGDEQENVRFTIALAEMLEAEVAFLHINRQQEEKEKVMQALNAIYRDLSYEEVSFHTLHFSDVREGISWFIGEQQTDMLVMSTRERTLLEGIFSPSLTKKIAYHPQVPLLVMHKK